MITVAIVATMFAALIAIVVLLGFDLFCQTSDPIAGCYRWTALDDLQVARLLHEQRLR